MNILSKYFKKLDDAHYENTRKIIVEASSIDEKHVVDHVVYKGSKWIVLSNGDIKYDTGHGMVLLDPSDPELADRIVEEGDLVIITL